MVNRTTTFSGCCRDNDKARSKMIDRQLAMDGVLKKRTKKVPLLGSGKSGKSTFLKQMRIINGKTFENEELKAFKLVIYGNIIKGMKVLIDARDKLAMPFENPASIQRANFVFGYDNNIKLEEPVFVQYVPAMVALWKDGGIQRAFDRGIEFQLVESIKYFLDNLERIGQMNYVPNRLDILNLRRATKGITEEEVFIWDRPFRFINAGGLLQRTKRQKWYHCFDDVQSIIFLVSSNEFDQVLYEDRKTNSLTASCDLFESIVNHKAFSKSAVILLLNKTDLLEEKIKNVSIRDYFHQFTGDPHSLKDVQRFLVDLFDQRRRVRSWPIFSHCSMTAIDTENIESSVLAAIIQIDDQGSCFEAGH